MKDRHKRLVVESSGAIFAAKGRLAEAFYARLFEIAPEARVLFTRDLRAQKAMFMQALSMAVATLDDPSRLARTAGVLGGVHIRRGVTEAHFALGARAFGMALHDFFGADCTPDLHEAWLSAYAELAALMVAAGQGAKGAGDASGAGVPPGADARA